MADDLNTEIKIGADASGVEAGVSRAKRSLKDLGESAKKAGQDAGAGIGAIGAGGDKAAKDVERATKNIQGQLQRAIASFDAGEKGSRKFYESLARQRGADVATLKPLLDQLDAYKSKSEAAAQASAKASTSFSGLGAAAAIAGRAVAAIGIATSVGEFIRLADASTNVASRLGLVTSSAAELANVQQRLFGIAQSSRVSFADLVGTYAQVARSTKDLGVSQNALLGVIQTISQAVTISGGSAASAQAALVQLSQGFAAGALRGEELNSIMEQTPRLAQAIADGMGVSVGKLRELGQAGALTAEAVLGALEKSAAGVALEFGKMAVTVEQASTNAANSVLKLVGAFDKLTGTTSILGKALQGVSGGLDFISRDVEKLGAQGPLRAAAREVINLDAAAQRMRNGMASGVLGPNAQAELDRINARLAEAKQRFRDLDKQLGGATDPRDQTGFTGRGASYANEAKRLAKLQEDANKFRLNLAGVPGDYIKDMNELIRLNQAGIIVGKEYTDALKKQQDELLKKTGVTKASNAAANQELTAYESLVASIRTKIAANEAEIQGGGRLTESDRLRIKLQEELDAGSKKLTASHKERALALLDVLSAQEKEEARIKGMVAAYKEEAETAEELARAYVEQSKAREAGRAAVDGYANGIDEANKTLQLELSLMGLGERARNVALEQYRIELDLKKQIAAIDANAGFDEKQREGERAKARAAAAIATANASSRAFLDEWKQSVSTYEDVFRRGFADMLNNGRDGWKSFTRSLVTTFKTAVADQIYKMFAQKFVVNIVGNLLGVVGGGATAAVSGAAAAASGGSALSTVGGIGSAISAGTSAFGIGASYGFQSLFANGLTGTLAAGGQMIGAGSIASGLGTIAGALGPIALGVGALMAIAKATKGETRTGGQFGVAFDGSVTNQRRGQTYTIEGQQFDRDFTNGLQTALKDGIAYRLEGDPVAQESAIREAVAGTASGINGFLKALGSAATLTGFSAGLETSSKGRGGVFAGGLLSTGAAFGESGKGDNYAGTLYEKFSTNSPDFKTALENFTLDLKQSTIQALQTVTDIPKSVQKLLTGVDAEGLADDAANKLLESINAQIVGVNSLRDAFKAMGLDGLAALGFDAAAGLAEVSGGFDKLLGNLNTYYSNFFSADEQRANVQRQLQQAFAGLNLTLPDINSDDARAQFRAIVEGAQQDLSESGQKTYATLLSLSGAFAGVTKELDGAATAVESISDAARNLKTDIAGLEIDLLRAKGDTTGANSAQRALDTTGLSAADVALYDYKQALIDQINTLNAASQAIADQTEIRKGFERQLLELSGDTAALRELDIQGMDAANVALYDRVQALQAEQAAEQAAAAAAAQQASTRAGFERQLLELQGDAAALRLLDIAGMDAANVALYDRVQALQASQAAEQDAEQAAAQQASTRASLERQLLGLQGDTAALRLLDIAGMDAANVALYDRIQALTASQAAEQAAADKAKQVAQERYGIETSMLQLQGNTAALRARELALLDPANRADQLRLYLLQDAQEAAKTAADAERDLAATRVQSAQDAYRAAQETTGSAFDALSRSVSAERSLYESTRAAAADAAQEIKSVIDTLSGSIQDLYAGVDSTRQASAAEGSAFIVRALQAARTTGYLPDSKGLSDAITQARGGLGSQYFATQFEADRAQLVMAGQLSELSDIAKPQLTAAERTLRNAENQLKTLDDILKNAQSQVDAVRGISTTVGTISDALFGLQAALLAEAQAKAQAQATTPTATAPTTPTTATGGALSGPYAAQITEAIKAAAYTTDDRLVYDTARMLGVTSSELDKLMGWKAGTSLDWAKRNNLPAFAVGTNYVPRDMLATIHEGEAIVPKAFNPWAAGGQGMGGSNAEVVAELRALRQNFERVQAELAAIRASSGQMAEQHDQVSDGGNANRVEIMNVSALAKEIAKEMA